MLVPMAQLELIGRRRLLDDHLAMLQHLRAAEVVPADPVSIDPVSIDPAGPDDPPADDRELATLLGRVDALLALIEDQPDGSADPAPVVLVPADPDAVPALVARCEQAAAGPRATLEHLRGELDSLPRTARSLAALLPLVPELVDLTDADLAQLRLATIVLVLDDPEDAVRAEIGAQLAERFGGRHLFVSAPVDDSLGCHALRLWVPRHRITSVADALAAADPTVVVTQVPGRRGRGSPPLLMRNPRAARPFERLVAFLAWPRSGSLDPTGLMAVVLPVLFGIMVGDVGYGLALVAIGLGVRARLGRRSPVADDAGRVLLVGGAWATVFGFLFGELFGDLGKALGMPALWFYRGGPEALTPLLLFVLGVGAAHIVLGLLLGLWLAVRERHLGQVLERGGSLLVLMGLFGIAGAVTSLLPGGALPVAAAAVVVGLVASSVPHGLLGVLLGPLESVSRIGNVLSYLRLAAVGLASVYLAIVANELGRQAPLLVGVVIAVFFHALNLALAAFSPMIQALRLHYVEFFGTFFEGGGRPFHPLGTGLPVRPAAAPAPAPVGVAPTGTPAPPPTPVPAR